MDFQSAANLERFFQELEPIEALFADPEFTYLLHSGVNGTLLVSARLVFQPLPRNRPDRVVDVAGFYGFSGQLRSLKVSPRDLISNLTSGIVAGPDRTWRLTQDHSIRPYLFPRNQTNPVDAQQKINELLGFGLSKHYRHTDADDWALRAAETPYSHFNDLISELGLNPQEQLHIIAFPPLVVDATSRVRGEVAELKLFRSTRLPIEKTAMGIVVSNGGSIIRRDRIPGEKFKWASFSEGVLVGTVEVPVDKTSVVHCLAVFDQQCMHHYWVGDPDASQNALRTIYELFDPKLEGAVEMLGQSSTRGKSDAHESAVAALLWMLGFSPLLIGRNSEAPDVIAVSRDNHFVIVECTLSDLQTKKQNKPQKLLDRTRDIKAALERSNAASSVCIPAMVTSRRREDIKADIDECERRGIVVFTKEDIEPLVLSTVSTPRSEQRFAEVRQRLDDAISRIEGEERQRREMASDVSNLKKVMEKIQPRGA